MKINQRWGLFNQQQKKFNLKHEKRLSFTFWHFVEIKTTIEQNLYKYIIGWALKDQ